MKALRRSTMKNRKGSALMLVAISLGAVIAMIAVGVEGGLLYAVHGETARAADAAALAGVTAFDEALGDAETAMAYDRALAYAQMNPVQNGVTPEEQIDITSVPDSGYLRVTVTARVSTVFARIFGINSVTVSSTAKAAVQNSGTAQCLIPVVMPDAWDDTNNDGIFDAGEYYEQGVTSYGTGYRDSDGLYTSDFARPIRMTRGNSVGNSIAGGFFTLSNSGEISDDCAIASVSTQTETAPVDPGFALGTVFRPINDIIDTDPGLTWNGSAFTGSVYPDWRGSRRVATVALYDPEFPPNTNGGRIVIVGFAGIFWDYVQSTGQDKYIMARFVSVRGLPDDCRLTDSCAAFNSVVRLIR